MLREMLGCSNTLLYESGNGSHGSVAFCYCMNISKIRVSSLRCNGCFVAVSK